MKRAGSSVPCFHSSATRRSVRLTRASVTSGIAESPRSIFDMQPAQLTPSTREIDMAQPGAQILHIIREVTRRLHDAACLLVCA